MFTLSVLILDRRMYNVTSPFLESLYCRCHFMSQWATQFLSYKEFSLQLSLQFHILQFSKYSVSIRQFLWMNVSLTRFSFSRKFLFYFSFYFQQESPPPWTLEAYRPRRITYSICYPRWGIPPAGVPPSFWPGLTGGYPRWGIPLSGGSPWPGLIGVCNVGVPPQRYP